MVAFFRSLSLTVLVLAFGASLASAETSLCGEQATIPAPLEHLRLGGFARALQQAERARAAGDRRVEDQALISALDSLNQLEQHPANAVLQHDFANLLERHRFSAAHRLGSTPINQLWCPGSRAAKGGLYEHLDEAIRSHERRLPQYARLTGGLSTPLFRKIARLQRLNLPIAWDIDCRARRFQKQGIPIICGDLVSMNTIAPLDRAPIHHRSLSAGEAERLRFSLRSLQKQGLKLVSANRFRDLAQMTFDLLQTVVRLENQADCHLAMTRHMLESLGLTALHADRYLRQSADTAELSRLFLTIQLFPMQECLVTDRKAQACHALGVGVIYNDVPHIPFVEEWEAEIGKR
ncbi:MAG TPA: hypothetical protein PKO06_08150 [Candidatus Ozemobacteraceae bacterium]|nr:hypothetical protein [Candidatus Ozemobacteraceae bacterium]